MANIVVTFIILAIIVLAITKIVVEKRKGAKCIGCPYSGAKKSTGSCSCA